MVSPPAQLGVAFAPGSMLGRYELLATIGVGGMASVILARQRGPAGFEKVVVVKVVHPHMAQDPIAVNMLLDEARLAAQIDHPNVVHTYELAEAGGTFYIVMEYLAGESLAVVLRDGRTRGMPMSPLLAAKIVADAAEGLHFAHELSDFNGVHLGIVHRDVSPGNIVVQYTGGVKVVDFGIAKANGRVTSTQEGELKGKYGYMAPEQVRNEAMDRRSDVFSLGVVLWEALAQRRLFFAENVAATLMQILSAERVAPSHFFPEIPHALDVACLKALDPDPTKRYQTVAEMKQAIDDAVWQARIGAREVEAYLAQLYKERMQEKKGLLARATAGALSSTDLEQIGTAFREANERAAAAQAAKAPPQRTPPIGAPISAPNANTLMAPAPVRPSSNPDAAAVPPIAQGATVVVPGGSVPRPSMFDIPPLPGAQPADPALAAVDTVAPGYPSTQLLHAPRVKPWVLILIFALAAAGAAATVLTLTRSDSPVATPEEPPRGSGDRDELTANPGVAVTPIEAETEPAVTVDAAVAISIDAAVVPPATVDAAVESDPIELLPDEPTPQKTRPRPPWEKKDPKGTAKDTKDTKEPKKGGGDPAALVKEASTAYMDGDFDAAEAAYKKAIAANKNYAPAYRGLGFVYERAGRTKKAIDALTTYLKLSPGAKDEVAITKRIRALGGP